ncbi:MAG: hypothetical protein SFV55_22635 [Haliscomenobacter sp.]|uniref:hypothetical protein n=1 Tax=Haliscomenobacter sp. TaxID=2717303 RepID=UPI0029A40AF2|nr:hypothetical protein [Haliscomenobacter sp.]MDX2071244.1 hypothetical protein [Haliscomenobacter sp.]
MVPELRKRHRRIWQFGSLFLVAGFIAAVWVLPQTPAPGAKLKPVAKLYPQVVSTRRAEAVVVRLRRDEDGHKQFEILHRLPRKFPFIQVSCNDQILGTMSPKGVDVFNIGDSLSLQSSYLLKLSDPINHQTVLKLEFP